jgi:hypothetical protein
MFGREQILANLVETEYALKDFRACLQHLQQLEPISPYPEMIRQTMADVKAKLQQQQ